MTREEFNERVTHPVTVEEYRTIEYVYNHHPAIDNVNGKNQIVMLYELGGMAVMKDMVDRAREADNMLEEMKNLRRGLEQVEKDYENLSKGV